MPGVQQKKRDDRLNACWRESLLTPPHLLKWETLTINRTIFGWGGKFRGEKVCQKHQASFPQLVEASCPSNIRLS